MCIIVYSSQLCAVTNKQLEREKAMKTKSKKILRNILLTLLLLLIAGTVYFFQFRKEGYYVTIPYRPSFEKIADNVYINKGNQIDRQMVFDIIDQARERDAAFFGELKHTDDAVIVIIDDEKLSKKLGEKATTPLSFPTRKNYIVISNEYFILDIVAHEMTHAEFHSRLNLDALYKVPAWFNEGTATQNDYREQYSEEQWVKLTDNGRSVLPFEEMDEYKEYAAGTKEDRVLRYTCAKHEVAEWIKEHSMDGYLDLLERLNNGEDFHTAYGK